VFAPSFKAIALSAALFGVAAGVRAEAPKRVVSVNLCTDQLALMLAAPGQLISVSRLAFDPDASPMVEAAQGLHANGSGAEEVYLLQPDLVLAGTFTAPATVAMLRNLGIEVVLFSPATALGDVQKLVTQMGAALGREDAAAQMIADYEATLAALSAEPPRRPRAALTYVNSYTSGPRTLAGDILRVAGFDNVAAEAGIERGGTLQLEQLVLLGPEVVIEGTNYPGTSRAEDNLGHPALAALKGTYLAGEMTDRDWICGTPMVLNAVRKMVDLRNKVLAQ